MSEFDISKVKRLTREDYTIPKITLDSIKKMSYGYLDEENPATYKLFLSKRPDLNEEEIAYYQNIINILEENELIKKEMIQRQGLVSYEEYLKRLDNE